MTFFNLWIHGGIYPSHHYQNNNGQKNEQSIEPHFEVSRQLHVQCVQIFTETIQNPPRGSGLEEMHGRTQKTIQHGAVQSPTGLDAAQCQDERGNVHE